MNSCNIKAILYDKITNTFQSLFSSVGEVLFGLQDIIISQILKIESLLPTDVSNNNIACCLCSTSISTCYANGDISWKTTEQYFRNHLKKIFPSIFVNAYECASWGYALHYFLNKNNDYKYYVIVIVDANVYDLTFWDNNPAWGKSGFGITTILFEKTDDDSFTILTTSGAVENPLQDFCLCLYRSLSKNADDLLVMPFFESQIHDMLANVLKRFKMLPSGHSTWGHCFGSDPWLSIILNINDIKNKGIVNIMPCSFALHGYYTIMKTKISDDIYTSLKLNDDL